MDWAVLIGTLITTILPLIVNKGAGSNKVALQRRAVRYQAISDAALAAGNVEAAFAVGEMASLCECLAAADSPAAQQQLLGAAQDAFGTAKASLAK